MAITYNPVTLTDIDNQVVELYQKLMSASTSKDSVYLKAKETVTQILNDAGLDARERAQILSQTIGSMVNGITAQSLQAAIDLAKDDRDSEYLLTKLREDTKLVTAQIAKVEKDIEDAEAAKNLKIGQGWLLQGQMYRDYGAVPDNLVYANNELADIDYDASYGTKYESIRQAQAGTYNTYAGSYRANGYVSLPLNADGTLASGVAGDSEGLVHAQTNVAIRQERGFDDNMRQHVANSSSSMISLLLSTEASGIDYTPYLAQWTDSIEYLNTTANVTAGTITTTVIPASISIAVGGTISGTTLNIIAGTSVELVITDGVSLSATVVALVQLDGSWSATFAPADLTGLIAAAGNVTSTVTDSTGKQRTDIDAVTLVA